MFKTRKIIKKTKQKLIIVVIFLVVFIVIGFYSFNNKDPYKKYNHIQSSEVLKTDQQEYWVYFYSIDNKDSIDSNNGISSLNKATNNVYFVEMKDKKIKIEDQQIQPTTLLYIKNHKIVKTIRNELVKECSNCGVFFYKEF